MKFAWLAVSRETPIAFDTLMLRQYADSINNVRRVIASSRRMVNTLCRIRGIRVSEDVSLLGGKRESCRQGPMKEDAKEFAVATTRLRF